MTCYLRMHEVLVGVRSTPESVDWDAVLRSWKAATSLDERDAVFARMPVVAIDVYDLPIADLDGLSGLVISGRVDQEFLHAHAEVLRRFLDGGGVVVSCGQLFRPWLPGLDVGRPAALGKYRGRSVEAGCPHAVFEGVDLADLGFSSALSGFWNAGNYPPEGAEVLLRCEGQPFAYLDRTSTPGTILGFFGPSLLGYATAENTTSRIVPQLVGWIEEARA